mmetsp:Transcript_60649/g.198456  ORF Transcript_60649/g.198456 Transcript_60649/m.198456 type:complete len:228 (+) Transcript_60649:5102-5785(+)
MPRPSGGSRLALRARRSGPPGGRHRPARGPGARLRGRGAGEVGLKRSLPVHSPAGRVLVYVHAGAAAHLAGSLLCASHRALPQRHRERRLCLGPRGGARAGHLAALHSAGPSDDLVAEAKGPRGSGHCSGADGDAGEKSVELAAVVPLGQLPEFRVFAPERVDGPTGGHPAGVAVGMPSEFGGAVGTSHLCARVAGQLRRSRYRAAHPGVVVVVRGTGGAWEGNPDF